MDQQVNALKEKGNAALAADNFDEAIAAYTEAITLDGANHVLYSNRSAAYAKAEKWDDALKDADKTIELNAKWPKGYSRKGSALVGLGRYGEAYAVYREGLEHDPTNVPLQQGKSETEKAFINELMSGRGMNGMNMNMNMDPPTPAAPPKKEPPPMSKAELAKKAEEEADALLPENKREAKRQKILGNEAYKKKNFELALEYYTKALEQDPSDITFHSNIAAVYFEQKEYQKCIAECEKGIEIGRENRADYKLIAKAFSRIGNAYKKMDDYKMAKTYYEKSMSEHRLPEVKALLSEVEKKIKDDEIKAYIDPVKGEEEKELGNEFFKKGDYANAVKHYSEAIKRNPSEPKYYSNRAACYTKLVAFDLALKDCDMCVKLDDKFIKGYLRKGAILLGMKQSYKALGVYEKALEIDPSNSEALEGYKSCSMASNSDPNTVRKNAMSDPEVQQILKDPAMRVILEQMQSDPKAMTDHLKNPDICNKIQKLVSAGIIQIN